jgi:two-component system LytT family sensor kinase
MQRLYRWGSNKYIVYAFHLLFWMLLIFPFLSGPDHPPFFEQVKYRMILHNSMLIILFYFNAYYLFPKVYRKKGTPAYILTVLLAAGLLMYISSFAQDKWLPMPDFAHLPRTRDKPVLPQGPGFPGPPGAGERRGLFHFPIYLFILGISFSYRLMTDQSKEEKKRKEQETESLKSELTFLRSQISPHFMFNVLNTLVAMARKKSDLMEPSLIQLSNIMRYVLYESNHNRIALGKEIAYLKNYVELQSLRFGDDLNLQLDISNDTDGFEIEPMLLIPFVENAFKHGQTNSENSQLLIRLQLDPDKSVLHFHVANEVAAANDSKDTDSGIGLRNVKRRLELLYADKYTLHTMIRENTFIADLQIELR